MELSIRYIKSVNTQDILKNACNQRKNKSTVPSTLQFYVQRGKWLHANKIMQNPCSIRVVRPIMEFTYGS